MIKISHEVLEGLIKEYVLYKHDIVIDDTYAVDINGDGVEVGKIIMVGGFTNVGKVVKEVFKVFEETQLKLGGKV